MNEHTISTKVIVTRKSHAYLARSLECNVLAQGSTADLALEALKDTIQAYVQSALDHGEPVRQAFKRASQKYWDDFEVADPRISTPVSYRIFINPAITLVFSEIREVDRRT